MNINEKDMSAPENVCVNLLPHQRLACNFVKNIPYTGLFLPTGSGKTCTILETLYELNPTHNVLILGPKPVMTATWIDEIEKWNFPFRVESLFLNEKGKKLSAEKRHEKYQSVVEGDPSIYFLNYELVGDLIDNLPKVGRKKVWPFPTVIIDEAQAFKSPSSKRFKQLKKMRPYMERVIELTGTPAPNGFIDLWSLIYLLDQGERLGKTLTEYRGKYFFAQGQTRDGKPFGWTPLYGAEEFISNLISDITISIDNIGDIMPEVTYNDIKLKLSPEEKALYKEMVKEKVLIFLEDTKKENSEYVHKPASNDDLIIPSKDESLPDGVIEHEAIAVNAAVLSAKLSQLASGAIYVDGTNTDFIKVHERKLDETVSIINNAGSPVIVAYHFKSDMKMLLERFEKEGIEAKVLDGSREMIHDWNEGKIPVLLLQPASSGHGLNLQYGGYTLIWYTLPWSLEHYIQTNARLIRQGQTKPVFIHQLMVEGTVDTKINAALKRKKISQDILLDAVKQTIEEAL